MLCAGAPTFDIWYHVQVPSDSSIVLSVMQQERAAQMAVAVSPPTLSADLPHHASTGEWRFAAQACRVTLHRWCHNSTHTLSAVRWLTCCRPLGGLMHPQVRGVATLL
jgi:hypothetical protein